MDDWLARAAGEASVRRRPDDTFKSVAGRPAGSEDFGKEPLFGLTMVARGLLPVFALVLSITVPFLSSVMCLRKVSRKTSVRESVLE
jgi:hypothetical protein